MISLRNKKLAFAVIGVGLLAVAFTAFGTHLAEAASSAGSKMPAIAGSVNVKQTMKDYVDKNTNTSFSNAASIAQKEVTNGSVVSGHIGIEQGFLVYTFCVLDTASETSYFVIVDAGNGKVLYKSEGIDFKEMNGFGHGGFMKKFGHSGEHFGKMMPQQNWSETPEVPQESQ